MIDWDKRQRAFQRVNRIFLLIYLLTTVWVLIDGIKTAYSRAILYSVVALLLLLAPQVVSKLFKVVFPSDCRFLFYLFVFGAVEFGSAMDGYDLISWWDLLLHCLSGALVAFAALLIFNALRKNQGQLAKEELPLAIIFMNLAATTSAAFWEYYEFMLDEFFGFNAQLSSMGTGDTMTDMMICTLGGLLISAWIGWSYYQNRDNALLSVVNHFYYRNRKDNR